MVEKNSETMTEATEHQAQAQHDVETEAVPAAAPSASEIDAIIRKRVYAAIGVGFVPVPLVDIAGLTAIQLELIHALANAYGVEFQKERVKSIISSLCGGVLSVATVPFFASIFKSIPVIGTTAGGATISIVGGASTYAIGKVFDRHFREGGNLMNLDVQETKTYFKTKLEEGKAFVSKMKPAKKEDVATDASTPESEATL